MIPYGTTLQSSSINGWAITGTFIILNCSTNSRPLADDYQFLHKGKLLYKGRSNIYKIAKVTMDDGGLYKCVPSNVMGRGEEASLGIKVTGEMATLNQCQHRLLFVVTICS